MNSRGEVIKIIQILAVLSCVLLFVFILEKLPRYIARVEREKAAANEVVVTIPEGLNIRQIGEILEKYGMFPKNNFIAEAQKEEGYLFPDTYRFYKNSSPEQVILRMRENFEKKITPEISAEILKQNKTMKDIVTMASILEEEADNAKDRKLIAGILWKRLKNNIGLQVDSTLTYVLSKGTRELTKNDLKIDSPYNTYRYRGLPVGPISNPGLDAIFAAIYPTVSQYFYYLSDEKGEMHYAKTFEEHKLNKARYLR